MVDSMDVLANGLRGRKCTINERKEPVCHCKLNQNIRKYPNFILVKECSLKDKTCIKNIIWEKTHILAC